MKNSSKPKLNQKTTLHDVFGWAIFLYQLFGFMPVRGILKQSIHNVEFSWISLRTFFSVATMIGFSFMTGIQIARFFVGDSQMADYLRLWYFLRSLLGSIFLFRIARNWRRLLEEWNRIDQSMRKYGWPINLKKKVNIVIVIMMVLIVVDYFYIQLHIIKEDIQSGRPIIFNMEAWNHRQKDLEFKYVFELIGYDLVTGIILLVIQLQALLVGTFLDVFIMIISLTLASRIQQVTERIKLASSSENTSENAWMELREDYNRLAGLCKFVNLEIGPGILLSFASNLGIILIQLFNTLIIEPGIIGKLYSYYVLSFLLVKTISVCLLGAKVNDESKKPLLDLFGAPDSVSSVEIDRLIRQITMDYVALSGMRFFYIRRNLVLQIAGSIVTYELVLIQFAGDFLRE